jgi:ribonuclease VapC
MASEHTTGISIDASALMAILLEEPGHSGLIETVGRATEVIVGAPTVFECAMVLQGDFRGEVRPRLMELLLTMDAVVIAFERIHFEKALDAFLRFGKGRHPAKLNFGDCMSYAVASVAGLPLLFTGNDFSKTDIESA